MNKKLIILDRDGVINYDSYAYIKSPDEVIFIPGSLEAIATLNRHDYQVLVATNQSGVSRGLFDIAMLNRIHEKILHELANMGGHIEEIFYCPHQPLDQCNCRKPKLGLFHQIQEKYQSDLTNTFFIGDSAVDMIVARTLPCKPLLVLTSNGIKTVENPEYKDIPHFENLEKAVEFVLSNEGKIDA